MYAFSRVARGNLTPRPSVWIEMRRATLGFGGKSKDFPMGLNPTPIVHVSANPRYHPGRSDFPSPVGDHAKPYSNAERFAKIKMILEKTDGNSQGLNSTIL